jgi:two-component system sensor histidine kinase BarA
MDLSHLPVIDWEQAIKTAGNQKTLAEDILRLLLQTLPEEASRISLLGKEKNYTELLKKVHKLHGALCYCGLPRLKTIVECLETNLKNNIMINLPSILDQFNTEVSLLLERYSRLNI